MVLKTHRTARRLAAYAIAAAAVALLMSPGAASAATISGTLSLSSGSITASHPVTVELWPVDINSESDFSTQTTNGAYSIDVPDAEVQPFYVVATDWPYYWYQETAYPNVPVVGDPSGGTPITPGVGNPVNITMQALPESFRGKVKDAKTLAGIGGISVETYTYDAQRKVWYWDEFMTDTAADGTYSLRGLTNGTNYRLGFVDYQNLKYADTFYNGKTSVATATTKKAGAAPQALGDTFMTLAPMNVQRITNASGVAAANVWTQSANVAMRQFTWDPAPVSADNVPDYSDVTNVVIASGDSKAAADPLSAAGLSWAYRVNSEDSDNFMQNAPLLLVSSSKATDSSVKKVIADIATGNKGYGPSNKQVTIHIVGGTNSVPYARFTEIKNAIVAAGGISPKYHRVVSAGDRYALAKGIALQMKASADASSTDALELAPFALVANGADSAKFFDPLAMSPIAAANGAPILLVSAKAVPASTTQALAALGNPTVYVGGGVNTIADSVKNTLGATRIWGQNRYTNAIAIANYAIAPEREWLLDTSGLSIASTIVDAQLGGLLAGNEGSPLLITAPAALDTNVKSWLTSKKGSLDHIYVVGSTTAVTSTTFNQIKAAVAR